MKSNRKSRNKKNPKIETTLIKQFDEPHAIKDGQISCLDSLAALGKNE